MSVLERCHITNGIESCHKDSIALNSFGDGQYQGQCACRQEIFGWVTHPWTRVEWASESHSVATPVSCMACRPYSGGLLSSCDLHEEKRMAESHLEGAPQPEVKLKSSRRHSARLIDQLTDHLTDNLSSGMPEVYRTRVGHA